MKSGSEEKKWGLPCFFVGIALALVVAPATAEPVASVSSPSEENGTASWVLRIPTDSRIPFRGVVSFDDAGAASHSMLYPAPNAAGLLAAVLTHGVLVESAKKRQKESLQEAADAVLAPYKSVLDVFSTRDLLLRALTKSTAFAKARLVDTPVATDDMTVLEIAPAFSMTQDQLGIVLDNEVAIVRPEKESTASYRRTVRVVSTAINVTDPVQFWIADEGESLKDQTAKLLAESIEIAANDALGRVPISSAPQRTVRYREGAAEKMERSHVLGTECGRMLIMTLRGMLMSVPVSDTRSAPEACGTRVSQASDRRVVSN